MIDVFTFYKFNKVNSTQIVAKEMIKENKLNHGDVISAISQTEGKGRYDRSWTSPKGNVFLTICLKPTQITEVWSQISYVVGVALCEAIKKIDVSCNPSLKWVNDILIDSKKVAGILLEIDESSMLLIGVGVNIKANAKIDSKTASFLQNYSQQFSKDNLIEVFLDRFKYNYNLWHEKGFEPIRTLWLRKAIGITKGITVRFRNSEQKGIFVGIDEVGQLQLLNQGNIEYISAGEVFFD